MKLCIIVQDRHHKTRQLSLHNDEANMKTDGLERKDVRESATAKLKTQMLKAAHSLDLQWNGNRVSKFPDIAKSWVKNKSDDSAKSITRST